MTRGKDHAYTLPLLTGSGYDASHFTILQYEIRNTGVKVNTSTCSDNTFPDLGNNLWQLVCADMRVSFKQNIFRSTMCYQYFENSSYVTSLLRPGVQLSVGISPGTSFTETIVGIGIYLMLFIDCSQIPSSTLHIFSSLQNNGL